MRRALVFTAGINLSLLSQQQKKKMKKDLTAKKRKQTNSSDEPDSKAAKTDGSDNSDSDNGKSSFTAVSVVAQSCHSRCLTLGSLRCAFCAVVNLLRGILAGLLPTLTALLLSEEGTEGESGEKEEKEGSRGVSNS